MTSIVLEFPDMYQNLPDLSVIAGGEELINWSLKSHFKSDQSRENFARAEKRTLLIKNQSPKRISELKLIFSHECDYAAVSDLTLEFSTTLIPDVVDEWTAELFINNQSTDLVQGLKPKTVLLF